MGIYYDASKKKWEVSKEKTDNNEANETGVTLYKITTYNYLNKYFPKSITYSTSPGTSQDLRGAGKWSGVVLGRIEADPNPIGIDGNTDLNGIRRFTFC